MGFEVQIKDEAFTDLDAILVFIRGEAGIDIARKWFASILNTIETLNEMPGRCPLAPESEELEDEIRVLLHGRRKGTYKIYFKIVQSTTPNARVHVSTFATVRENLSPVTNWKTSSAPQP